MRASAHGQRYSGWLKLTVLLWVIGLLIVGCRTTIPPVRPTGQGQGEASLPPVSSPTLALVAPGEPSPCPPPTVSAIPSPVRSPGLAAYALLAVTQHAHTSVVALDARGATSLTGAQVVGRIRLSAAGRGLAYEVLEGTNPLSNFVVAADLVTGAAWRVVPGDGCAVFGFALDAMGEQLALLQVAMRGQFKPAAWQMSVAELASGRVSTLGPARPQEVALEPVAWSAATDEIIVRAFVPFQAHGAAGLWAVHVDASRLRPLLSEPDFVGKPRLAPDGRLLAFFASEPENLPEEYVASPGEPPANAVRVLDLVAGEMHTLAVDAGRAFDALAWDAAGEGLYLSRGAWRGTEHGFWFDEIVSLSVDHSAPQVVTRVQERIVGLQPCAGGGLVYITVQGRGAMVHKNAQDAVGGSGWVVENGSVEILACDFTSW